MINPQFIYDYANQTISKVILSFEDYEIIRKSFNDKDKEIAELKGKYNRYYSMKESEYRNGEFKTGLAATTITRNEMKRRRYFSPTN
jgi:hypothetical protein